ncbi:MAG: 4-hydroxy-3-methylbut-2-enyl diphosphate reductase [Clostridia bacterium]|jgi:4-hydroxy-3-methylbut-2-enyl diphosphate reductase|nr:4-hydroxy-3-methylbut-2-enyl diphosphate reductase [Clostridia bacterium]
MKILFDKNAGFCFGVKNAVDKVFSLAESNKNRSLYTYGPLIHNNQVIEKLEQNNVQALKSIDESIDKSSLIAIRSHGIAEDKYRQLQDLELEYVDCTCPFVLKIHRIVNEYSKKGYQIFIVGDAEHPEVQGINGWCENKAVVIENSNMVENLPNYDKICIVAQTTITQELWSTVLAEVQKKYMNVKVFETICSATENRQKSAADLAKKVECMIIIGSKASSNTQKLYQICKSINTNTIHIETAIELSLEYIKSFKSVGITAGASTPEWIIKEVVAKMDEMNREDQAMMMEEYEKSFKSLYSGDTVTGKVIFVTDDEVMVDIGYKSDGIIKKEEFTWDHELSLKDLIKPGDEVESKIVNMNDGEGNVVLSKKLVDADKNWYKIEYAYNEKSAVDAVIKSVVKGGVVAETFGIKAFIPASLIDIRYAEDLSQYVNTKVKAYVAEYDKEKRKVILSRKEYLRKEREVAEKEVFNTIQEGQKVKGEVKRLTDFGAFVDIGGVDGLIHVSELSWNRIKHPSEVVKPGQVVEAIVLKVDNEKKKISLGLRQTTVEPWSVVPSKYAIGDIINVKVARFADFGAFVELEPGVDGLVHISQISDKRIAKPADVLKLGQMVKAKIVDMKLEEKKISLSIKEAVEAAEAVETVQD